MNKLKIIVIKKYKLYLLVLALIISGVVFVSRWNSTNNFEERDNEILNENYCCDEADEE